MNNKLFINFIFYKNEYSEFLFIVRIIKFKNQKLNIEIKIIGKVQAMLIFLVKKWKLVNTSNNE